MMRSILISSLPNPLMPLHVNLPESVFSKSRILNDFLDVRYRVIWQSTWLQTMVIFCGIEGTVLTICSPFDHSMIGAGFPSIGHTNFTWAQGIGRDWGYFFLFFVTNFLRFFFLQYLKIQKCIKPHLPAVRAVVDFFVKRLEDLQVKKLLIFHDLANIIHFIKPTIHCVKQNIHFGAWLPNSIVSFHRKQGRSASFPWNR